MLTVILVSIWLKPVEEQKVCFHTLLLLIKIVCLHNRLNLGYNFLLPQ